METTPVEFSAPSGLTLTLKLFPYGSDVIANGATGDGGTERTNANSVYSADVTQALSEWHNAVIVDGSGNVIASGAVYLHDTTDIHRVEEPPVHAYAVLPNAAPGAVDGVFIAGTNAETTVTTAINANIIGDITGTLDTVTTCTTTTTNTDMRGTNSANTTVPDAAGVVATALGSLQTHGDSTWATAAGFNTVVPPSVAEFEARTLVAADYFDPSADTVATVAVVGTVAGDVTTDVASRTASKADVSALALAATALSTVTWTSVRAAVLSDWINDGRLDLLLDAVKAVTDALTAATAAKIALSGGTIVSGAAAAGTLSTTQMTTDLTEVTNDHYNGRIIIWTSGVLQNQATDITDYAGVTKMLTFTAVTEAPSAADSFVIV